MKQEQFSRLEQAREHIGKSYNAISKELDLKTPQVFYDIKAGKSSVSYELARAIQDKFLISSTWLLTGEGDMLASDQPREYDVETAQKLMEEGVELIPMYSEPFCAGNRGNDVGTEQGYISSYWAIPNLRATEVIQVTGDSMEPTIPRGTPVAVAPVYFRPDEPLQLSFGDIFAISTRDPDDPSEYVTIRVKRLYKHEDKDKRLTTWIAHSDNDMYEDFEIPISHVVGLWRVLAGVNYYS